MKERYYRSCLQVVRQRSQTPAQSKEDLKLVLDDISNKAGQWRKEAEAAMKELNALEAQQLSIFTKELIPILNQAIKEITLEWQQPQEEGIRYSLPQPVQPQVRVRILLRKCDNNGGF